MSILSRINEEMYKTAANPDNFDEQPPELLDQQYGGQQPTPQQPAPHPAPPPPHPDENYAAVPEEMPPEEEMGEEMPETEEIAASMGIQAANDFLAQALGDARGLSPEEIDVVSKTAGEIAGKITETMLKHLKGLEAQMGEQMPEEEVYPEEEGMHPPENGYGQQQQMGYPNPTNEEYMANQIAPAPQQGGQTPYQGGGYR